MYTGKLTKATMVTTCFLWGRGRDDVSREQRETFVTEWAGGPAMLTVFLPPHRGLSTPVNNVSMVKGWGDAHSAT